MNEQTSTSVGSLAGVILNGKSVTAALRWLDKCATRQATTPEEDETHALTLLGAWEAVRSIAASALTQRPTKKAK